jgi:hypothetical protein
MARRLTKMKTPTELEEQIGLWTRSRLEEGYLRLYRQHYRREAKKLRAMKGDIDFEEFARALEPKAGLIIKLMQLAMTAPASLVMGVRKRLVPLAYQVSVHMGQLDLSESEQIALLCNIAMRDDDDDDRRRDDAGAPTDGQGATV